MKPLSNRFFSFFCLLTVFTIPVFSTSAGGKVTPGPSGSTTAPQKNDDDKLFPYPIPADLPIPKKSERVSRSFRSQSLHYTFGCSETSSEIISFYRDQLPKLGWKTTVTSASENKSGPLQNLLGKKEADGQKKSCEIRIVPIAPGTLLSGEGTFSNPPFQSYVVIRYSDPALVAKPIN